MEVHVRQTEFIDTFFKLYALDTELDLDPSADAEKLEKAMEGHIIDSAELIGLYSRE